MFMPVPHCLDYCRGFLSFFFFLKILFYLFLDRGEGREKERERNINVWLPLVHPTLGNLAATQACVLAGNQTYDPLVHRLVLSPLSHTSQGCRGFLDIHRQWL